MSSSGDGNAIMLLEHHALYWEQARRRFAKFINVGAASDVSLSKGYVWLLGGEGWTAWHPERDRESSVKLPGTWRSPVVINEERRAYAIAAGSDLEDAIVEFDSETGHVRRSFTVPAQELLNHCQLYRPSHGEAAFACQTESGQRWNESLEMHERMMLAGRGPKRIVRLRTLGTNLLEADWTSQSYSWGSTVWNVKTGDVVATFTLLFAGTPRMSAFIDWPKPRLVKNLLVGVRHRFEAGSAVVLEVIDMATGSRSSIPLPDSIERLAVGDNDEVVAIAGQAGPYWLNLANPEWRKIDLGATNSRFGVSRLFDGNAKESGLAVFDLLLKHRVLACCDESSYCELYSLSSDSILWQGRVELPPRELDANTLCWAVDGKPVCMGPDLVVRDNPISLATIVAHGSATEQISEQYCSWNAYVVPKTLCGECIRQEIDRHAAETLGHWDGE